MKKIIILFVALCTLALNLRAQERMMLYELFTSENCPPSRQVDSMFYLFMNGANNPSKAQYVTYSVNYNNGYLYTSDKPDYDKRDSFYNVSFISYGRLDGLTRDSATTSNGFPMHLTQDTLNARSQVPTPFQIQPSCDYDANTDSFTLQVHIHCVSPFQTATSKFRLRTAFVRTLDYLTPPGTNGQLHFENVVRKMFPNAYGTILDTLWQPGDTATVVIKNALPSEYQDSVLHHHNYSPGHFVIWLQDDATQEVLQSAYTPPLLWPTQVSVTSEEKPYLAVYPNPVQEQLTLHFHTTEPGPYVLSIYDSQGRKQSTQYRHLSGGDQLWRVDVSTLAEGFYTAELSSFKQKCQTSFLKKGN